MNDGPKIGVDGGLGRGSRVTAEHAKRWKPSLVALGDSDIAEAMREAFRQIGDGAGRIARLQEDFDALADSSSQTEIDVDRVAWAIVQSIYSIFPDVGKPKSWGDVDAVHEVRIRAAAKAAIDATGVDKIQGHLVSATKARRRMRAVVDAARDLRQGGWGDPVMQTALSQALRVFDGK